MADDKNKASTDAHNDGSVVGTFEPKKFRLGKRSKTHSSANVDDATKKAENPQLSKRQKVFFVLGLAAVVVVGGILAVQDRSSILKISGDGKSFTVSQKEYDALLNQAKETQVPADVAKKTIIKAYQYKIVAPGLKLEPTADAIASAAKAGANYSGEGDLNKWQQLYGYVSGVEGNLKLAKTGGYNAAKFVYPFDKVYYDAKLEAYNPNADKSAIQSARQAAEKQAKNDRQELIDKKTTVDQLISKIQNDQKYTWAGGSNSSKQFDINTSGVTTVDSELVTHSEPEYIMSAINSLNQKSGVSEVQEIRATVYGAPQPDVLGFFFVTITEVFAANPEIQNELQQLLKSIEVSDNAK